MKKQFGIATVPVRTNWEQFVSPFCNLMKGQGCFSFCVHVCHGSCVRPTRSCSNYLHAFHMQLGLATLNDNCEVLKHIKKTQCQLLGTADQILFLV